MFRLERLGDSKAGLILCQDKLTDGGFVTVEPKSERYLRLKKAFRGASDKEIAARLHVSKAAVSQWKTGAGPSDKILIRAAEVTKEPLEWLITGADEYRSSSVKLDQFKFPGQATIARLLDEEFKRVSKLEEKELAVLMEEVAEEIGVHAGALYNFRSGKWPLPASIVSPLCKRFGSTALLKPLI